MKKYVVFICCAILAACTDSLDLSPTQDNSTLTNQNAQGIANDLEPVPSYQWTKLSTPPPEISYSEYSFMYPRAYVIGGTVFAKSGDYTQFLFKLSDDKETWQPGSDALQDAFNNCTGYSNWQLYFFSYGSRFYYRQDGQDGFYSTSVNSAARQTLTPFPGAWRVGKMSFVIGTKGYVMGGERAANGVIRHVNDLWEYNFATDQWTYKGMVPGGNRSYGVAVVLGNKLYFGLGYRMTNEVPEYKNDWLQIDFSGFSSATPQTLSPFPGGTFTLDNGGKRPFTANNKIYVYDDDNNVLWEYDPDTDNWSEKESPMQDNAYYSFFSIGSSAYMIKGPFEELWRYSRTPFEPTNP